MSELAEKRTVPVGRAASDPVWLRRSLIGVALAFLIFVLVMPVVLVFAEAFRDGAGAFIAAVSSDDTLSAIGLTATAVAIAVPVNVVIGVATAWAVGRFRFPGRSLLITMFDVPLAVSPVIAGMTFILLFGSKGLFGETVASAGLEIVFSPPGIVLATIFVTFPFVARELIPFWESQGKEEEEAALVLGASAWTMFLRVSLPNARWALLYGVVLTTARAMGEFGAVSVVSGHIRGKTSTLPLHVEVLYGDYRFSAAFAVATLLVLSGVVRLILRKIIEARAHSETSAR